MPFTDILTMLLYIGIAIALAALILWYRDWRRKRWLLSRTEDQLHSEAYALYEEYGISLDLKQRLMKALPNVPEETLDAWLAGFHLISSAIDVFAQRGGEAGMTKKQFDAEMTELFPWMGSDALWQAWRITNYTAWHEGWMQEKKKEKKDK